MKFFCSTVLMTAAVCGMVSAFSPATFGVSRATKTRVYLNDPEMIHHLAHNIVDAARVVMQECNNQECAQVEGFKAPDGTWQFTEGPSGETKARVVMFEIDGTEG